MFGYIYETTNLINGKKYIGKRTSPKFIKNYFGSGALITRAIKKYGKINFSVKMIECVNGDGDDLNKREQYWIAYYNAVNDDNFYNLSKGGDGTPGYKVPENVKEKISLSVKNHINNLSNEEKERRSKKQSMAQLGSKRSKKAKENMKLAQNRPEVKKKRSESLKKVKRTDEWKQKIGKSHKGKIITEETRIKISNTIKGSKWMNNGIVSLQVKPYEISDYILQGYVFGRMRKNKIPWNKKLPCGHIYKDKCNCINKGV